MRIGELSRRSGVSPRSLRYYENQGLIRADRSANGYREYGEDVVEAARNLHLLFALGVSRELARSVLACSGNASDAVHRATHDQLTEVRDRLAERIVHLSSAHAALSRIVEQTR